MCNVTGHFPTFFSMISAAIFLALLKLSRPSGILTSSLNKPIWKWTPMGPSVTDSIPMDICEKQPWERNKRCWCSGWFCNSSLRRASCFFHAWVCKVWDRRSIKVPEYCIGHKNIHSNNEQLNWRAKVFYGLRAIRQPQTKGNDLTKNNSIYSKATLTLTLFEMVKPRRRYLLEIPESRESCSTSAAIFSHLGEGEITPLWRFLSFLLLSRHTSFLLRGVLH